MTVNRIIVGELIEKQRILKNMTREELAEKLQLEGLNMDRTHILRLEKGQVILKDFELIIIAKIIDLDLNSLKETI